MIELKSIYEIWQKAGQTKDAHYFLVNSSLARVVIITVFVLFLRNTVILFMTRQSALLDEFIIVNK